MRTRDVLVIGLILVWIGVTGVVALGEPPPIEVSRINRGDHEELQVTTGLADYLFSTRGGVLRSVFLTFGSFGDRPLELIPGTVTKEEGDELRRDLPQFPPPLPFELSLTEGQNYRVEIEDDPRLEELKLKFTHEAEGLRIIKIFTIHNDPSYTIDLDLSIVNIGSEARTLEAYRMILAQSKEDTELRYLFDGGRRTDILAPASYNRFGGLGFVDRNTVLFLKNETESEQVFPNIERDERGREVLVVKSDDLTLFPFDERNYRFTLYAGRNKFTLLDDAGLAPIVDLGFFRQFLVPAVRILDRLFQWTGNYAWAIIIFTVVIRVVLIPVMRNQYRSMARMSELRPKMAKLQKKYKNDRQKLNQKMMELYREEGVNPLGGCLPALVQIPILILLWRAILFNSERIHFSPGFLWIPDLSLPDPFYILIALNIGAMILQNRLSMTVGSIGGGGFQSQIFMWVFPFFIAFLLRNFPAGMWLYYLLQTVLQVGQQYWVNRELAQERTAQAEG
ncbi:MAG: membrane protein insertase YidC [Candidatus Bipolaricaulia bacterium]